MPLTDELDIWSDVTMPNSSNERRLVDAYTLPGFSAQSHRAGAFGDVGGGASRSRASEALPSRSTCMHLTYLPSRDHSNSRSVMKMSHRRVAVPYDAAVCTRQLTTASAQDELRLSTSARFYFGTQAGRS